jgi:hypothetical protein
MELIIPYLLTIIQYQYKQICWLLLFIAKFIPLKQWAFDDSHSPKYQKFKTDTLPKVIRYEIIEYQWLVEYYRLRYNKIIKPVSRHADCDIPSECSCPRCNAPMPFLYKNNGSKGQLCCKVCGTTFNPDGSRFSRQYTLRCPYCSHALEAKKHRKNFVLHKCINSKCSYYLHNKAKVSENEHGHADKSKYKLHYIYREFTVDFFQMDLDTLPKNASSLRFRKNDAYIMSLCLTLHVNLGLSLRKTAQALKDLYNISISHQMVANYARTAAVVIKPFVDHYEYCR